MGAIDVSITTRAINLVLLRGATDSTAGSLESLSCRGDLEAIFPTDEFGFGLHLDLPFRPIAFSIHCPIPGEGGCEFQEYRDTPVPQNWIRVRYRTLFFVTWVGYSWSFRNGQCSGEDWTLQWFTLGLAWLTLFWRVRNVQQK